MYVKNKATNTVIFMLCSFCSVGISSIQMYRMYFILFDINVKMKCNSALGLQCLIS